MSRRTGALCVLILLAVSAFASDVFKLSGVKRLEKDLYKADGGVYIETKYCYHYAYGEDAILKWSGKYGDNKIIWDDDSSCDVEDAWRK